MQTVPKGTKVSVDEVITKDVLTKEVVTQVDGKDGPCYQGTWKFDFKGVSRQELISLASRTLVIERQATFRRAKPAERSKFQTDVLVREYLDNKRSRSTPEERKEKALKVAKTLSKADLEALLKSLQEEDAA